MVKSKSKTYDVVKISKGTTKLRPVKKTYNSKVPSGAARKAAKGIFNKRNNRYKSVDVTIRDKKNDREFTYTVKKILLPKAEQKTFIRNGMEFHIMYNYKVTKK